MYDKYLVTGATGNLGSVIVRKLTERGSKVRALIVPGDLNEDILPPGVEKTYGRVNEKASLDGFFSGELSSVCVIHCAGIVSIATTAPKNMRDVNVKGTKNIAELCAEKGAARLVYVSSVHALREKKGQSPSTEEDHIPRKRLWGGYAKTKSTATSIVKDAGKSGLNIGIVYPSGILSPFDKGRGNISAAILSYLDGKLPLAVSGGYDFVDVRDAADGVIACADMGRPGEGYILSGRYATLKEILGHIGEKNEGKGVRYLPLWLIKALSPFFELASILAKKPRFLTPYSAHVLGCAANFSKSKAEKELGYRARDLFETLDFIVEGLKKSAPV